MKVHRFYYTDSELSHELWIHNSLLLKQWSKVLRFNIGEELILFDGDKKERLYQLEALSSKEAQLKMVTEIRPKLPKIHVYLMWSLLKKDNNDLVLQKATEIGVTNFLPILTERTIRTNFNIERAKKIVIEAAEQSGRFDIPNVREPINVKTALTEFESKVDLFVAEQGEPQKLEIKVDKKYGVFVGPEGGWSSAELELFENSKIQHLNLGDFTLRAETAAITAAHRLLQ